MVQDALGVGQYNLEQSEEAIKLSQSIQLDAFAMPFTSKNVYMERTIREAKNPLIQGKSPLAQQSITYCGYHQTFILKDESQENNMYLEPWILNQVNPGGKLIIPYTGEFSFVDYYDPVDEDCQKVHDGFVELNLNGARKFKVAYHALNTLGRSAYLNKLEDGRYYAHFRNYNNDPSNPYCCEPADKLGENGCSLYVYNDFAGGHGGFAEYENSGTTLGLDTHVWESRCDLTTWWFIADKNTIEQIVNTLLGIKYSIPF